MCEEDCKEICKLRGKLEAIREELNKFNLFKKYTLKKYERFAETVNEILDSIGI